MSEKLNAVNLWFEVGNKCLKRASELLDVKTTSILPEDVEAVKGLVDIAVTMAWFDLQYSDQSRSRSPVSPDQFLARLAARS